MPMRIRCACAGVNKAGGRDFCMASNRRVTVGVSRSSRRTSRPALARWAAMRAPIVPAPSTAALRMVGDIDPKVSHIRKAGAHYPEKPIHRPAAPTTDHNVTETRPTSLPHSGPTRASLAVATLRRTVKVKTMAGKRKVIFVRKASL